MDRWIIVWGEAWWSFVRGEDCWVYDQSPTLIRSGEDHGYIRMDKYLHWYEAFWGKAQKQIHEGLGPKWTISYHCGDRWCPESLTPISRSNLHLISPTSNRGCLSYLFNNLFPILAVQVLVICPNKSENSVASGGPHKTYIQQSSEWPPWIIWLNTVVLSSGLLIPKDYSVEPNDSRRPFKALLDVGLARTTTSNRVFEALKHAFDGGLYIPHNDKRFNKESKSLHAEAYRKHIFGGHVASYMKTLREDEPDKYQS